jgi:hypothetical protein
MAVLAAFLLLFPGTPLDRLWALNPRAQRDLTSLGSWIGFAFLFLAALGVYTARLWFQRRLLGWRLSVAIIATQILGDAINIVRGDLWRGSAGLLIASLLLLCLLRRSVRASFHPTRETSGAEI